VLYVICFFVYIFIKKDVRIGLLLLYQKGDFLMFSFVVRVVWLLFVLLVVFHLFASTLVHNNGLVSWHQVLDVDEGVFSAMQL